VAPAACVVLAGASLWVPALLGFDPWVWLIWGRELTVGLPTTDGSVAWKPLPVLVTPLLTPFGDAAPALWLVLSRAAGLFGVVLVWRLAALFAGAGTAALAGTVAAAAFLLTPDDEARWIRHLLQGNIEPVTVMLCLWAVQRHLVGRRGQALLLGVAAALTRPEVWPLLALYAAVLVWREPRRRWWQAAAALAVVPLLWFGGDRLVSGYALAGASTARVLEGTGAQRVGVALAAVGDAVIAPVWVAAAVGVGWAGYRRRGAPLVLAAGAVVWVAEVVAMAGAFGYAALGRFLAPVSAVLCVLAGLGVARLVAVPRGLSVRTAIVVAVVAAAVPFAAPRASWLPLQVTQAGERAAEAGDLDRLVAGVGAPALLACGPTAIDTGLPFVEVRPALAWALGLPVGGVPHDLGLGSGVVVARSGGPLDGYLGGAPPVEIRGLGHSERWVAYAQNCPAEAEVK